MGVSLNVEAKSLSRGGQNDDFRPLTYTLGGGAWGAASYESLPAPLATQIPTLRIHISGGGCGGGGALILDRCRAFDLFASVDAHLCLRGFRERF
jgi:hypothetical protein